MSQRLEAHEKFVILWSLLTRSRCLRVAALAAFRRRAPGTPGAVLVIHTVLFLTPQAKAQFQQALFVCVHVGLKLGEFFLQPYLPLGSL
eukprot:CAMPEP_0181482008 /NCGR_PEP_ID=MMETSP1110-20121109/44608_1 /TAXON_ID=174948 /ORGANISM="Symbiodinium sp., Strain CCMP421" /LENGTH=88 /DNA_ID=CAMNT_0023607523 /DNA_START=222 /DNA_END=488 /DNA_ORIENTATION=-